MQQPEDLLVTHLVHAVADAHVAALQRRAVTAVARAAVEEV
jgi:hypothetical protein